MRLDITDISYLNSNFKWCLNGFIHLHDNFIKILLLLHVFIRVIAVKVTNTCARFFSNTVSSHFSNLAWCFKTKLILRQSSFFQLGPTVTYSAQAIDCSHQRGRSWFSTLLIWYICIRFVSNIFLEKIRRHLHDP